MEQEADDDEEEDDYEENESLTEHAIQPSVCTPEQSPQPPQPMATLADVIGVKNTETIISYPGWGHELTSTPKSACSMWQEWHGTDDFLNVPIAGGIAAMESKYKSKWRTRRTISRKQRQFSNLSQTIQGMKTLMAGRAIEEFFDEMDEEYKKKPCLTSFTKVTKKRFE